MTPTGTLLTRSVDQRTEHSPARAVFWTQSLFTLSRMPPPSSQKPLPKRSPLPWVPTGGHCGLTRGASVSACRVVLLISLLLLHSTLPLPLQPPRRTSLASSRFGASSLLPSLPQSVAFSSNLSLDRRHLRPSSSSTLHLA